MAHQGGGPHIGSSWEPFTHNFHVRFLGFLIAKMWRKYNIQLSRKICFVVQLNFFCPNYLHYIQMDGSDDVSCEKPIWMLE